MKFIEILILLTIATSTLQTIDQKKLNRILKEIKNLQNPPKRNRIHKTNKTKNNKKKANKQQNKNARNLFLPYYYNPTMMSPQIATHISSQTSTVPPYKTEHKVAHTQNPLSMDPYMSNPYYSPFYHGISPFTGFSHFNPFLMPGGPQALNPLYSGYPGMQYMSKMPQVPAYRDGFKNANIVGQDVRKLTNDAKEALGTPGEFRGDLQGRLNLQEALSQEEMNQQLATLSGVSKEEYKDYKMMENEADRLPKEEEDEEKDLRSI